MRSWKTWLAALMVAALAGLALHQHRSRRIAHSARDFVERYSDAYRAGDVDAILAMRYDLRIVDALDWPAEWREELQAYRAETERESLERELERDGMWARAGASMAYVSERSHENHIHVEVDVAHARTEIILMRHEGRLLVHPRPNWVDGSRTK